MGPDPLVHAHAIAGVVRVEFKLDVELEDGEFGVGEDEQADARGRARQTDSAAESERVGRRRREAHVFTLD